MCAEAALLHLLQVQVPQATATERWYSSAVEGFSSFTSRVLVNKVVILEIRKSHVITNFVPENSQRDLAGK